MFSFSAFHGRRQKNNKSLRMDVSDLETFLGDALGPDSSMNGPHFLEHAMKVFNWPTWSTIVLLLGTDHAEACNSLRGVLEAALNIRFSPLCCFGPLNAGKMQQIATCTIQVPSIVLTNARQAEINADDWHLHAVFTIDLLEDDRAVAAFMPQIWERCSSLWASTSRTALYGAIFTPDSFRAWKFDRQQKTLSSSIPVPLYYGNSENELITDEEEERARAVESGYHQRVYLALLRVVAHDRWMMQDDKPQCSSAVG